MTKRGPPAFLPGEVLATQKEEITWMKSKTMSTIRRQKHAWFRSCKQDIPGTRPLRQHDFASVDQPRIASGTRSRHGVKPPFKMGDRVTRPKYEKLYSNGWLQPAALRRRSRAERCKRHSRNSLGFMEVTGILIACVPNWASEVTPDVRKKWQAACPSGEPQWQEGGGSLLLVAAAHETGLLETIEQA